MRKSSKLVEKTGKKGFMIKAKNNPALGDNRAVLRLIEALKQIL